MRLAEQSFRLPRWLRSFVRTPLPATLGGVALLALGVCGCSPKPPAHGTAILVALETNQTNSLNDQSNQVARVRQVLRERLDRLGVRCFIETVPPDRLLIKLPLLRTNELDAARDLILRRGLLEFRMVHPESSYLVANQIIDPGHEVLREERTLPSGQKMSEAWLVNKTPERGLTGKYIRRAMVSKAQVTGAPEINFELDHEGARLFEQITTEYRPHNGRYFQLAIVLDGKLYSAPRITGVISGGRGLINGNFTLREAMALATVFENPLEVPCRIIEEKEF